MACSENPQTLSLSHSHSVSSVSIFLIDELGRNDILMNYNVGGRVLFDFEISQQKKCLFHDV